MMSPDTKEPLKTMSEVFKEIDSINQTYYFECFNCGSILSKLDKEPPKKCNCGENAFKFLGLEWDVQKEKHNEEKKQKELMALKNSVLQLIIIRQEDRATEEVVKYILENNYLYSTKDDLKSEIWVYDSGIYKPNGESQIREICRKILSEAFSPQRVNKVIEKIRADTYIESEVFFKKEQENLNEIPVQNGILNIFTRELSDFTPKKIFFNKLPVIYDKEKDCPTIKKFFSDILRSSEDSKVMFELFGYCLLKEYRFEKAFMLVGGGRNGKGKSLGLLKRFLGAENCCSVPLSQMKPESTSVCELFGRLVNVGGDLSNDDLKSTGMFKQLTGRDLVNAKRKFLRDLIFVNYCKLCFACNELPRVFDFSIGFWTRWILLEFPYRFVPKEEYAKAENKEGLKIEDTQIIDKITTPEELSGLLNESLNALDRLLKNNDFSYTRGTSEVKDFWVRKSDSFTAFCFDSIEEKFDGSISRKDLRKKFNEYCKCHKIKGSSDKSIRATLQDLFGATENRKWNGSEQEYIWEGIGFKKISQISIGFSKHIENGNMYMGQNTLSNLSNFTDSEIKASGLTEQEIKEALE